MIEEYYQEYWSGRAPRAPSTLKPSVRVLLEKYIPESAVCLDVGCGNGRVAGLWHREKRRRYIGVDISETALQDARALDLTVCKIADASRLPFERDIFDAVLCRDVFEHLFAPHLAAAEILRVLKPGGVLVATVPNVAYWRNRVGLALQGRWSPGGDKESLPQPWRDPHLRFFTRAALRRMILAVGFSTVSVGGHEGTLVGACPLIRKLELLKRCERTVYQYLLAWAPSLFGHRLHAIATK